MTTKQPSITPTVIPFIAGSSAAAAPSETETHGNAADAVSEAIVTDVPVYAANATLADWVCSGALSTAELAAAAAQLLPQIEHELELARAAERKAEPLAQILRRGQRANKRARNRR